MRNLAFLFLIMLFGCELKEDYAVIVYYETSGPLPSQEEAMTQIKAKTDNIAYFDGAMYWFVYQKMIEDREKEDDPWEYTFNSFEVINKDGDNIADLLSEETKVLLEEKARASIYKQR